MLSKSSYGVSIRDGFLIAILGKPNTGKSSFINNISGRDISIVTNQPGTTRDLIESFVDIFGYPVKFIDTAGIRKSKDSVEKIGVKRALDISKKSYLNLIFIQKREDIDSFKSIKNKIFIKSKNDLKKNKKFEDNGFYNISSKTSFGIDQIFTIILNKISQEAHNDPLYISRERHISCLKSVNLHLKDSLDDKSIDLFAEDVRLSLKNMTSLFGNVDIEEILDIIFSDFCIGK